MYISKVEFNAVAVARSRFYAESSGSNLYKAHQELWTLFGDTPDRLRDFLYRQTGITSFLVVSERLPVKNALVRTLDVKPYDVRLAVGDELIFSLRFNPVIKRRDNDHRQVRVDMVQDERKRLEREGVRKEDMPRRSVLAQKILMDWFRRHDLGFNLEADEEKRFEESLQLEAYGQHRFSRPKGGDITISGIDVRGIGMVRDPDVLCRALYDGVGCARGFGFGLLLVRRR
ncbi:MAG: type I-E CRISPR-associated protein Cas6/Cse3/CasE [bacterium]|nr:type I-E CRISPR-associated protein Cas6/Cse3/CasE [bacterium]